eukprot:GFUD01038850.1.p1 GENE.GFUD01038850.1~~GFUD01038850.1.p1  ORF type:complete len:455 (-),score=72.17 GFUD01038850.1:48-1412(-)
MTLGEDTQWLITYFPVAWTGHICQGLAMGIFGPTQPYLAQKVGVASQQINFIWTLRAFGSCFATVITGLVFKAYIKERSHKLAFLAVCVFLTGFFIGLVPWTSSFELLLTTVLLAGIFIGSLDTASNSLVLYMLGPDRSRPYTQSLHAFVGMGFVLGSLIVRPFLPETEDNSSVCNQEKAQSYSNVTLDVASEVDDVKIEDLNPAIGVPDLAWPFLIIATVHLLTALGYLCLILGGLPMPRFYETVSQDDTGISMPWTKKEKKTKHPKITLFLAFFYFAFSCGLEGFFQSQTFTFGICGPHKMEPGKAAALTTVYFSSFLAGRFSGVLLSTKLKPHTMILTSLLCCILSALLLVFTAASQQDMLFVGTGSVGFFVSLQFASGYSWLAEHVDLTGRGSSVVFVGANFGWLVFPPLAGLVFFSSIGPMGLYYLTLGLATAHLLLFAVMIKVSSIKC